MSDVDVDSDEFEFPLRISTHERCGDPCPEFRARTEDRAEFEPIGSWGPFIETQSGEPIAEGHRSVRVALDAILGQESDPAESSECASWECSNEAAHTVEMDGNKYRYVVQQCGECVEPTESRVAAVDDGLGLDVCDSRRCFNVVHESRTHCVRHRSSE